MGLPSPPPSGSRYGPRLSSLPQFTLTFSDSKTMPDQLEANLAGLLNSTEIAGVFGSITSALTYSGTPAYDGIVRFFSLPPSASSGRSLITA